MRYSGRSGGAVFWVDLNAPADHVPGHLQIFQFSGEVGYVEELEVLWEEPGF